MWFTATRAVRGWLGETSHRASPSRLGRSPAGSGGRAAGVPAALAQHRAPEARLGLLLVDLDRFKQINDHCGHLMGDHVLKGVAQEIMNAAQACDLPCRLGGDEFALLAQVADLAELESRAAQIAAGVRALRFPDPNAALRISVSVGGGLCQDGAEWSIWYSEADISLYEVKGQGGDAWKIAQE